MKKSAEKKVEVTIVDFNRYPESHLKKMLKEFGASVTDWIEKDYGYKLFIEIPEGRRSGFRAEIEADRGYSWEI